MKNLSHLIYLYYIILVGLVSLPVGCSSDQNKSGSEADLAFNDFKEYVTTTETTTTSLNTMAQSEWDKTLADAQETYNAKVTQLEPHEAEYNEARQEEIADLKNRFNIYWQQRKAEYTSSINTEVAENTGNSSVVTDFQVTEVVTTAPENIRLAYENLVNRLQLNKDSYTNADWKIINDYYLSLDERRDAVQTELSDKDKLEISKAKAKYVALKTAARFEPEVNETAEDVKNAAENTGQKVSAKAENASSKVKVTAKKSAEKVGNAAEKVGSEIKSTTKKVTKKIDSKLDTNPDDN